MQIPRKTIKNWKLNLDHGDITKISEETGISKTTLSIALNKGMANAETIKAINLFIKNKLNQIAA